MAYAGVNRPDVLQRSGSYPPPPGASPHLGLEVSGTVIATGPQASRWRVGDQVCALTPGGGYAQYCLADERHCLPVPRGMDLLTAAAIPRITTRSGPMCSSARGWRRASASWCTAAPAASA